MPRRTYDPRKGRRRQHDPMSDAALEALAAEIRRKQQWKRTQ